MARTDAGASLRYCASDCAAVFGFTFSVLFAGVQQANKYVGLTGVGLYLLAGITILLAGRRYLVPVLARVTEKKALIFVLATLCTVLIAFVLLNPVAQSGSIGGGGDSDDALELATKAMLHGQYPYDIETYLGAPATYLPGSLLLAVPFVVMGDVAYQNLFWTGLLIVAMSAYLKDIRQAILLFWMVLLCPRVLQSLVTGAEVFASAAYMLVFVLFAMKAVLAEWRTPLRLVAAVLLGIGLSSRANYLLLIPVIVAASIQRVGWKVTTGYAAVTAGTFLAITLPFWLYDPQTFWRASVMEQNSAAAILNPVLPHADLVVPAASVVIALLLSLRRLKNWSSDLLSNCALTQAFPVLAMFVISGVRGFDLGYTDYGMHFLFFGALAGWKGFMGRGQSLTPDAAAQPSSVGYAAAIPRV